MRLIALTSIVLVLFVCTGTLVYAEDAAQDSAKILLKAACPSWAIREYQVDVGVKGRMPGPDGKALLDVDSGFSLTVKHKYTRRESDGLIPLEINVTKGEAVVKDKESNSEQKMAIAPASYPKLTVLLDRNCYPTDVFGIIGTRYAEGMPGLNYGNMIILFIPPDMGGQPRAVGEKWETKLTIPNYQETYSFVNALRSVDTAAKTAVIAQEISWRPKNGDSTVKAVVESTFLIEDGKLIKSHADCQVMQKTISDGKESTSSQQEAGTGRANISVDIALIK